MFIDIVRVDFPIDYVTSIFFQTTKNLVHLQIRKNKLIDENSLERLFLSTSLQHLRYLDLTECMNVTDVVVKALCKWYVNAYVS